MTEMAGVYDRAGCILRVTKHDGLPRMLMERLLRGMYAIYSRPLSGCWEARTPEEIQRALVRYHATTAPNIAGREAMLGLLRSRPDERMAELIANARVPLASRGRALALAVRVALLGGSS